MDNLCEKHSSPYTFINLCHTKINVLCHHRCLHHKCLYMYCDVTIDKQNVVAYQQMIFKSFEHYQVCSVDVTMCHRNNR